MTDSSNRYGNDPLGKSVEEVENDSGNRVNSSVEGERVRHDHDGAAVLPTVVNGTTSGVVPAILNSDELVDDGGAHDDARRRNTETSET
ncbi:hypothetical protein [Deinococcus aerophilus]|uniref:Uncharacterized protein n=1 Tax=Deinococcus aerophilus TaxID=522488 RepID=A0ABQ2GVM6_9DEIO|nr:hypothetical protein [Deinococcus aerophilus]GGM13081.1 hypothetical protein GCM10010841_22100 [Deinococcus aerophilus]